MIHAKDLMIGNYLNTSFGVAKIISIDNVGITFKNKDGEFDIDFHDEDAWIQEIPLTTEILEKNGFSRNGLDIALFDRNGGDDLVGASNLQYVHELQHCLRLLGINKEIVL